MLGFNRCYATSLVGQIVKNLPPVQEIWAWSLGWEDTLEKGMATNPSILAWRIPGTEGPGRLVHGVTKSRWLKDPTSEWSEKSWGGLGFHSGLGEMSPREQKWKWEEIKFSSLILQGNLLFHGSNLDAHHQMNGYGSYGTYTQWNITQPLKRIHLNQF